MNTAIILAGGVGSRVGADIPKQFIEILGKPIISYTIEIYDIRLWSFIHSCFRNIQITKYKKE